jgi:hypothetical protein
MDRVTCAALAADGGELEDWHVQRGQADPVSGDLQDDPMYGVHRLEGQVAGHRATLADPARGPHTGKGPQPASPHASSAMVTAATATSSGRPAATPSRSQSMTTDVSSNPAVIYSSWSSAWSRSARNPAASIREPLAAKSRTSWRGIIRRRPALTGRSSARRRAAVANHLPTCCRTLCSTEMAKAP